MGYFVYFVLWTAAVGGLCYFNGFQRGRTDGIRWATEQVYGPRS